MKIDVREVKRELARREQERRKAQRIEEAAREAREHCPAHFEHVSWFKRLGKALDLTA